MLFSEPKIPQTVYYKRNRNTHISFSALQRAENSSNVERNRLLIHAALFQCSSASRKFLKFRCPSQTGSQRCSFQCSSASRKFLKAHRFSYVRSAIRFQCSSASRKFLKGTDAIRAAAAISGFSALQRAENSSKLDHTVVSFLNRTVSVLFSEPKIPQKPPLRLVRQFAPAFQCSSASRKFLKDAGSASFACASEVSVLFSEPKIPQTRFPAFGAPHQMRFSALQRAENSSKSGRTGRSGRRRTVFQCSSASRKFLKPVVQAVRPARVEFQCSSASRKFLKIAITEEFVDLVEVSVLFSEPKIPQIVWRTISAFRAQSFSALQRAENSSNRR